LQATAGFIRDGQDLNFSNFCQVDLPVVPLEEQKAIAEFIAKSTVGTDITIARLEREIALLREYRTRLVADVVTGKLDVRPAARQLPAEIETPALEAAGEVETTDPAELAEMEATTE